MALAIRLFRPFRLLCLTALCLVVAALPAFAQSPEAAKFGEQSLAAGGFFNATHLQYGNHWVLGAGAFVDANITWRYGIEGEATWTRWHQQSDTHANTWLIGPRYRFPAIGGYRFEPYAKFLIGDGRFNFPYNYGYGNYLVMAPGGGVDYHWKRRFDVRLCDVEYQIWHDFSFGSNTDFSVSAGIRYHIF